MWEREGVNEKGRAIIGAEKELFSKQTIIKARGYEHATGLAICKWHKPPINASIQFNSIEKELIVYNPWGNVKIIEIDREISIRNTIAIVQNRNRIKLNWRNIFHQ